MVSLCNDVISISHNHDVYVLFSVEAGKGSSVSGLPFCLMIDSPDSNVSPSL